MPPDPAKLGILAGGGQIPGLIIDACRESGRPFFVIGLRNQVDAATLAGPVPHEVVRLGNAGKAVKILKKKKVAVIVLAGHVQKPKLKELRPDLWTAKFLARAGGLDQGDDTLLSALVRELERREGFRVAGIHQVLPHLLATAGVYGQVEPDAAALADLEAATEAARRVGALDKGQGAVVRAGSLIEVEDRSGTDAMLIRAARHSGSGGVLVKIRKPNQEMRADLPTIGIETVRRAADAGLAGIAVEAGGALVVERENTVRAADEAGLFVMGFDVPGADPR